MVSGRTVASRDGRDRNDALRSSPQCTLGPILMFAKIKLDPSVR